MNEEALTTASFSSGVMIHSSFFGSVSGSSGVSPSGAAFLPGPPLAQGESFALKSVPEAELIDRANRRMSSV